MLHFGFTEDDFMFRAEGISQTWHGLFIYIYIFTYTYIYLDITITYATSLRALLVLNCRIID